MNYKVNKKRVEEIDIVKALAMISVVLVHASFPFSNIVRLIPLVSFFIASGFVYKSASSDSLSNVKTFFIKRVKGLWLPFFVWTSIFILLNNVLIKVNIYTNNSHIFNYTTNNYMKLKNIMTFKEMIIRIVKSAYFSSATPLTGACWFLAVLFKVSILYCIIDYLIKKITKKHYFIIQTIVSIVFLVVGYMCHINHFMGNSKAIVFSYYFLFHLGIIVKKLINYINEFNNVVFLLTMLISFGILLALSRFKGFDLSSNNYFNPAFLIIDAIASWCFLYSVSVFINKIPIKSIFTLIGQRTISILVLHFLSFKIVAFLIVKIYKLPEYCLAAFPNLYGDRGLWWLAYTLVGIAVPILLNEGYRKIIGFIKDKR